MKVHILLFLSFSFLWAQAQSTSDQLIADLNFYSDAMVNAESYTNRLRAHDKFSTLFKEALTHENAWNLKLEAIPFIHSVVSPDSLFKIYTFHLVDLENVTQESGFIHMKDNRVFELESTNYLDDLEYNQYSPQDWLSGIYYHIIPFEKEEKKMYLLFSFSQPTAFDKRKVIEVLSFENGNPVFGAEVFVEPVENGRDIIKNRRVYTYSADVSMVIQYDKDFDAIIVDHLMEVKSRIPGNKANTAVPDGTYTSYALKDGNWIYKDMVFEPELKLPKSDEELKEGKSGLFKPKSNSNN